MRFGRDALMMLQMARYQTLLVVLASVIALILVAMRANRNDKHPKLGALLWVFAITLLVWGVMVSFAPA